MKYTDQQRLEKIYDDVVFEDLPELIIKLKELINEN